MSPVARNSKNEKWDDPIFLTMQFKTRNCALFKKSCNDYALCPYFHTSRERRRTFGPHKYSAQPCDLVKVGDEWKDPVYCPLKDGCSKCHTRMEQQFHPEVYKKMQCKDHALHGTCPRGLFCAFAHNDGEMQGKRNPDWAFDWDTILPKGTIPQYSTGSRRGKGLSASGSNSRTQLTCDDEPSTSKTSISNGAEPSASASTASAWRTIPSVPVIEAPKPQLFSFAAIVSGNREPESSKNSLLPEDVDPVPEIAPLIPSPEPEPRPTSDYPSKQFLDFQKLCNPTSSIGNISSSLSATAIPVVTRDLAFARNVSSMRSASLSNMGSASAMNMNMGSTRHNGSARNMNMESTMNMSMGSSRNTAFSRNLTSSRNTVPTTNMGFFTNTNTTSNSNMFSTMMARPKNIAPLPNFASTNMESASFVDILVGLKSSSHTLPNRLGSVSSLNKARTSWSEGQDCGSGSVPVSYNTVLSDEERRTWMTPVADVVASTSTSAPSLWVTPQQQQQQPSEEKQVEVEVDNVAEEESDSSDSSGSRITQILRIPREPSLEDVTIGDLTLDLEEGSYSMISEDDNVFDTSFSQGLPTPHAVTPPPFYQEMSFSPINSPDQLQDFSFTYAHNQSQGQGQGQSHPPPTQQYASAAELGWHFEESPGTDHDFIRGFMYRREASRMYRIMNAAANRATENMLVATYSDYRPRNN